MTRHRLIALLAAAVLVVTVAVDFTTAAEKGKRGKKGAASAPTSEPAVGKVLSIRGVVRKGSDPAAGIEVKLAHSEYKPVTTDDAGRFAFYDVAPGTYTIIAGNETTRTTVIVEANRISDATLSLRGARPGRTVRPGGVATPGHTPGKVHTPK